MIPADERDNRRVTKLTTAAEWIVRALVMAGVWIATYEAVAHGWIGH